MEGFLLAPSEKGIRHDRSSEPEKIIFKRYQGDQTSARRRLDGRLRADVLLDIESGEKDLFGIGTPLQARDSGPRKGFYFLPMAARIFSGVIGRSLQR